MDNQERLALELALEERLRDDLGALSVSTYAYYREGAHRRTAVGAGLGIAVSLMRSAAALAVVAFLTVGVIAGFAALRGPNSAASLSLQTGSSSPTVRPTPSALPATQVPTATPTSDGSPPPLNRLERTVIDTLATFGIAGQRGQLPFDEATIYARLPSGAEIFVNAWPTGTDRGVFTVIEEWMVDRTRVDRVQYAGSSVLRDRFACAQDTYEVSGAVPPTFADRETFVAQFIRALPCGGY